MKIIMSIKLFVEPNGFPITWNEFLADAPQNSIALDGYVKGGPKFDLKSVKANFNHHEEVDRLATRSTCSQVLMALRMGSSIPLDTTFKIIGGNNKWSLIQEIGSQARTGVFAAGIKIFVSIRERPDNKLVVVIGKLSPFIPLDLLELANKLNQMENCVQDCWGGGENIIGSPRVSGTGLDIKTISQALEEELSA